MAVAQSRTPSTRSSVVSVPVGTVEPPEMSCCVEPAIEGAVSEAVVLVPEGVGTASLHAVKTVKTKSGRHRRRIPT